MSNLKALIKDVMRKANERKALAKELASKNKSIKMYHENGHKVLVGSDMSKSGKFRVTRFDVKGAMGHSEHDTLEDAANEALRNGFKPK